VAGQQARAAAGRERQQAQRERAEAQREARAERAFSGAVAALKTGKVGLEAVLAAFPDMDSTRIPILSDMAKEFKKQAKLAEKKQTDEQVGNVASDQFRALGPGGTSAQLENTRNQRQDLFAGLSPEETQRRDTQLEAGVDTIQQDVAAKAEKDRLANRSPITTLAEEGGYSAERVRDIARAKVEKELAPEMSPWEQTETARLNAGLITQEAYNRRQGLRQDNLLAASRGPGGTLITVDPETGAITIAEGTTALEAMKFRKEWASSQVIQDRLTNAEIANIYMVDMTDTILKHPTRAIVGGTGKVKRTLQNFQGLLLDVDRQFGVNLVGWAENGGMKLADDLMKGTISGQEMDPDVQERLGLFLDNFDPTNATLDQLEYIISYNLVAMRQRGSRVSTNAAIDRQAKRLGLTRAKSTDAIISSLRLASKETQIVIKDLKRRLETDFNKVRPITTLPEDIPSNNPLVTDPRSIRGVDPNASVPSGPLQRLDPQAQQGSVFRIENGKFVPAGQ